MIKINSNIYTLAVSSCGALTTIPIDLLQTKIISNQNIEFKIQEFKWIFYLTILFSIQSIVFKNTYFLKSYSLRGAIAGFSTIPIYILIESKKNLSRLNMQPIYKKLIKWIAIRQILLFSILYKIMFMKIHYSNFISAFIANSLGFPLKILALKNAYPNFNFNYHIIKKTAFLEILKSSLSDGITLYLLNKK